MNEMKQDIIDRYIRGEMNAEERKDFEQKLVSDDELRDQYKYTLSVKQCIASRKEKEDKIKRWKAQDAQNTACACRPAKHRNIFVLAALSAAAILIFLIVKPSKPTLKSIDADSYETYRGSGVVLHVAALIEQESFDKALYVIETEEKKCAHEKDSIIKLSTTSASSDDSERYRYEKQVADNDLQELQWLKVYALIGMERYDEALTLLDSIRKNKGKYCGKADSLYNEMK